MKKYPDQHVHTEFSPDAEAYLKQYLVTAKELGLEYLMVTDHRDFGNPHPLFLDPIDYDHYFKVLKEQEEKHGMPIRIGVEIGYGAKYREEIEDFLNQYPFDFVIASIHNGEGKCFYSGDFFEGKGQHESYYEYFKLVLDMVQNFSNYDVIGHLDYITRYGPFDNKVYSFSDFQDIIDRILGIVIENNKGIELNTSGLRGELKTRFPKDGLLLRFKELGGKVITVGSDCHTNNDYLSGVSDGIKHLKSLGFTEVSAFNRRKREVIKI